mgnify:CR=1 FL=1
MSDTVLVTGASGYIGSHIVANLLSKGKRVRATVREPNDEERVNHLKKLPIESLRRRLASEQSASIICWKSPLPLRRWDLLSM